MPRRTDRPLAVRALRAVGGLCLDVAAGVVGLTVDAFILLTGRNKPKPLKRRRLWYE